MFWGALATLVGGALAGKSAKKAASQAADSSLAAAEVAAQSQKEALDYLKQREAIPTALRDQALTGLGGLYGVNEPVTQQSLIEKAMASPLYQAILGNKDRALEDVTARAGATGNLRSGSHQVALQRESERFQNQALLTAYQDQLQGLQGLAGLQGNEDNIAALMSDIGNTRSMGMTAAAQAKQMGTQNAIENMLGFGQLGVAGGAFSDLRLKTNVQAAGRRGAYNWYTWIWNEEAGALGLVGPGEGVLAHEVYETHPDAIGTRDGFLTVDYTQLLEH